MNELKLTVTINKPVSEVFEFATNPKNTPKWIDFIDVEEASDWPPKVGSTYRNKSEGREWSEYDVYEYEKDKLFTLNKPSKGFFVRYVFTPTDDGSCELEYSEQIENGELEDSLSMEVLEKLKKLIEET